MGERAYLEDLITQKSSCGVHFDINVSGSLKLGMLIDTTEG